jgi:DNA-binding response OmpR family regulator
MSIKILVADDHINDRSDEISRLPAMIQDVGYQVIATPHGDKVYDLVLETNPDLVVLDIRFGDDYDLGFEICSSIRSNDPDMAIILITSYATSLDDILRGFEMGINDYVVRPRDNREIIARIRANLPPDALMVDNYLCLDLAGSQVYVHRDGRWHKVHLQPLMFELIKTLVVNAGLIMLTTNLKIKIWPDKIVSEDVLAKFIHDLREKIEPNPKNPAYIETIKGFGYRFNGKPVHISRRLCDKLFRGA